MSLTLLVHYSNEPPSFELVNVSQKNASLASAATEAAVLARTAVALVLEGDIPRGKESFRGFAAKISAGSDDCACAVSL